MADCVEKLRELVICIDVLARADTQGDIEMMGQQGGNQDQLFYSFNLDSHVPADHLLRGVHRFFDVGELREHLAAFYSHTGRPSIDPELMIRMLIMGYCFALDLPGLVRHRTRCASPRLH